MEEVYAAHAGELYGFAVRTLGDAGLAEEAVEETFLRAWRTRDRLDHETTSVRTRLFAILRDVMVDLAPMSVEPPEWSLLTWQIEEAMRRIGEQHRQVLLQTYYRGRTYAEVATELGLPEATMKSRVYDGLRALAVALEEITAGASEDQVAPRRKG
jgi:RNA polymerase sigma-70 factor (ECF subfamily)